MADYSTRRDPRENTLHGRKRANAEEFDGGIRRYTGEQDEILIEQLALVQSLASFAFRAIILAAVVKYLFWG